MSVNCDTAGCVILTKLGKILVNSTDECDESLNVQKLASLVGCLVQFSAGSQTLCFVLFGQSIVVASSPCGVLVAMLCTPEAAQVASAKLKAAQVLEIFCQVNRNLVADIVAADEQESADKLNSYNAQSACEEADPNPETEEMFKPFEKHYLNPLLRSPCYEVAWLAPLTKVAVECSADAGRAQTQLCCLVDCAVGEVILSISALHVDSALVASQPHDELFPPATWTTVMQVCRTLKGLLDSEGGSTLLDSHEQSHCALTLAFRPQKLGFSDRHYPCININAVQRENTFLLTQFVSHSDPCEQVQPRSNQFTSCLPTTLQLGCDVCWGNSALPPAVRGAVVDTARKVAHACPLPNSLSKLPLWVPSLVPRAPSPAAPRKKPNRPRPKMPEKEKVPTPELAPTPAKIPAVVPATTAAATEPLADASQSSVVATPSFSPAASAASTPGAHGVLAMATPAAVSATQAAVPRTTKSWRLLPMDVKKRWSTPHKANRVGIASLRPVNLPLGGGGHKEHEEQENANHS